MMKKKSQINIKKKSFQSIFKTEKQQNMLKIQ